MDRLRAPGRPHAADRDGVAGWKEPARVCMRADKLRGNRGRRASRAGIRARPGQDRALRRYGRMMMDELDGNGAAGLLQEIFGREMTVAVATCASCGAVAPIGGGAPPPAGTAGGATLGSR